MHCWLKGWGDHAGLTIDASQNPLRSKTFLLDFIPTTWGVGLDELEVPLLLSGSS